MDESGEQDSKPPADAELAANPLSLYLERIRQHAQGLEAGDDLDVAVIVEMRKLLNFTGMQLPSDRFLHGLKVMVDGGQSDYFRPKWRGRQKPQLVGIVAHLADTLIVSKAFSATEAAEEIHRHLSIVGIYVTASTVTDRHELVVHSGKRADTAWDVYEVHQKVLRRTYPEHRSWGAARLQEWLAQSCRRLARNLNPPPAQDPK